ncbi:MAG: outer membrane beta-barrel protein [Candidatus Firestonebacteria bacterium]|nr:outer membrane beta-barrel protein [Candidatus Firestonebacteria bacterium]
MTKKLVLAIMASILVVGSAVADDAKAPKWYDKIGVSGYLDAYYQINPNGLSGNIVGRAFDTRQNEFAFSGAKIAVSETDAATGIGGELDLLYGPVAFLAAGGPVEQAFGTFSLGPVGFKVGKFTTHLGYEVIETPANLNYSRSLLFNQVPFYHVGAEATYSPLEGLGLMVGVVNGNSIEQANDEAKDIAAQVTYSKISGLSLIANYYLESNRTAAGAQPFENTHYLELVGNYQALPALGVGCDYLYKTTIASTDKDADGNLLGDSSSPKSQGYALYANYVTPVSGLSVVPRFEQWYAPDAYALAYDYTLTAKYAVGAITHYLELRQDIAYPGSYLPPAGETELKSTQMTLTYGVTYSF